MAEWSSVPVMGVDIGGVARYVPKTGRDNQAHIDHYGLGQLQPPITPAGIIKVSGIEHRRIADPAEGEITATLSVAAGRIALERAGVEPGQVTRLILATTTPDRITPPTSTDVQAKLGLPHCLAVDLSGACAGFMQALEIGYDQVAARAPAALIIGTDRLSEIADFSHRNGVLFGDGSGAVVLRRTERDDAGLLSSFGVTDGNLQDILYCAHGQKMEMNGREVFENAVRLVPEVSGEALAQAELTPEDIKLAIFHQANWRILKNVAQKLRIPSEKMVWTGDQYANTSAASIPITLAHAIEAGRLERGDNILFAGFGAGMTAMAATVRY